MPPWFASTVHVPGARNETVEPDTPHTEGLPEEKVTARPELAAAVTVYVGPPVAAPLGGADVKLIVWPARFTTKDCETWEARLVTRVPGLVGADRAGAGTDEGHRGAGQRADAGACRVDREADGEA